MTASGQPSLAVKHLVLLLLVLFGILRQVPECLRDGPLRIIAGRGGHGGAVDGDKDAALPATVLRERGRWKRFPETSGGSPGMVSGRLALSPEGQRQRQQGILHQLPWSALGEEARRIALWVSGGQLQGPSG